MRSTPIFLFVNTYAKEAVRIYLPKAFNLFRMLQRTHNKRLSWEWLGLICFPIATPFAMYVRSDRKC